MSNSQPIKNTPIEIDSFSKLSLKEKLAKRDLYGGAMTISIPAEWRDVSDVRQVPDHQEVYQDCTFAGDSAATATATTTSSNASMQGTGGCIVIEILERQDDVSDEEASSFFYHDLADANNMEGDNGNDNGGSKKTKNQSLEYSHIWSAGVDDNDTNNDNDNSSLEEKSCDKDNNNIMPNLSTRVKACTCIGIQGIAPLRNKEKIEEGKASRVRVELCVVRLEAVQTDLLISLSMPIFSKNDMNVVKSTGTSSSSTKKKGHSVLFKSILESFEVVDWSLFG